MPASNKRLALLIHIAGWLLLWVSTLAVGSSWMALHRIFTVTNLHVLSLMVMFYLNSEFLVGRYLESGRYFLYAFFILILAIGVIAYRFYLNKAFIDAIALRPIVPGDSKLIVFPVITTLTILGLSTFYKLLSNRYQQEKRHLAIINEQKDAQLTFLRAQINPHFLFNTLNNIYALTVIKSELAPKLVVQLSNLLRYVIYESQHKQVGLDKEVEHIRLFIDFFQIQQRKPVDIQFELDGGLSGYMIEPMVLIPLIENCFKHCDFDDNPAAFVRIQLKTTPEALLFETHNTYNPEDRQKDRVGGVGLLNIRKRLTLSYSASFQLETSNSENQYHVKLNLPLSPPRPTHPSHPSHSSE